jgi:tripartite-type tricarboxylate transporter receptor subunit TctC
MRDAIFQPDIKARLEKIGVVPWGLDVNQTAELVARETKRWTDVVRAANVTVE